MISGHELYGNLASVVEGEQLAEASRYQLHAGLQIVRAAVRRNLLR